MPGIGSLLMAALLLIAAPRGADAKGRIRPVATVGGPSLVQAFGYDPVAQRLYYEAWHNSYSGPNSREILFLDLSRPGPVEPMRDTVLEPGRNETPEASKKRLDRFRNRLIPLRPMPFLGFELETAVLSSDTLGSGACEQRFRVRVAMHFNAGTWEDTLVTFEEPRVEVIGISRVPRPLGELVLILAYIGEGAGHCWERQTIFIVPKWWSQIGIE